MFVSSAFQHFLCTLFFFSTACLKFSKLFSACWNFSSIFPFLKKDQKKFWVLKSFGKNNLDIFSSKLWPCTIFSKLGTVEESPGQRGAPGGPPRSVGPRANGSWAPPSPTASWPLCLAPSWVHSHSFLQIEAERGVMSSHAHSLHSHSLSHILARFPLDFDSSLIARTHSLSFICCKIDHIFGGTTFG